jgi:DNA-binding FadR family transcriptional regulator
MIIEKNKSMREKVYDTLKQMIIDGVIKPGERIIEKQLQDNDVLTFGNSTYVFHDKRKG